MIFKQIGITTSMGQLYDFIKMLSPEKYATILTILMDLLGFTVFGFSNDTYYFRCWLTQY